MGSSSEPAGSFGTSLPLLGAHPSIKPSAVLRVHFRRVPRAGSRITPEVAEMILERCVAAARDVLSTPGTSIEVGGAPDHPVIEAEFRGAPGPILAARAAVELTHAVRRVQRASENEFLVGGALVIAGWFADTGGFTDPAGFTDPTTSPDDLASTGEPTLDWLFEGSPPGQILLSERTKSQLDRVVVTSLLVDQSADGGRLYALRDLR